MLETSSPSIETAHPRLVFPPQNLVVAGIQGAGKNVQGTRLMHREQYDQFVTSSRISQDPAVADRVKAYQRQGILVPDDTVMPVVEAYLRERSRIASTLVNGSRHHALQTIWDGLPRTPGQKRIFDAMLEANGREPAWAVKLEVSDETAWSNIAHRAKRPGARADDGDPDVIRKRIATYHAETQPVLDAYGDNGRLVVVDAEPGVDLNQVSEEEAQAAFEAVYARLVQAVNSRLS